MLRHGRALPTLVLSLAIGLHAIDVFAMPSLHETFGLGYLEAWLHGHGAVPIYNLMEDAATAEISRSQIWQWIRSPKGVLDDGTARLGAIGFQWADRVPWLGDGLVDAALRIECD